MDEAQGIQKNTQRQKVFIKDKTEGLEKLCKSAMLHGSEAWCFREKEMAILRRTERAMIRAMCGVTLLDRKNSEELMDILGIKESLDKMAKVCGGLVIF